SSFCTAPHPPALSTLSLHDALPIFFHVRQANLLALGHPRRRNSGGPGDDLGDLLLTDDRLGRRGLRRLGVRGLGGLDPSGELGEDRKSTRLNSSHVSISYAVFCLKK